MEANKKRKSPPTPPKGPQTKKVDTEDLSHPADNTSYVTIKGFRYYSDRFYLDAVRRKSQQGGESPCKPGPAHTRNINEINNWDDSQESSQQSHDSFTAYGINGGEEGNQPQFCKSTDDDDGAVDIQNHHTFLRGGGKGLEHGNIDVSNYDNLPHAAAFALPDTEKDTETGNEYPNSPPLFSRKDLVEEVHERHGIKAAIASTYCFSQIALVTDYPLLFGSRATIPTMLIHGDKEMFSCRKSKSNFLSNASEANGKRSDFVTSPRRKKHQASDAARDDDEEEINVLYCFNEDPNLYPVRKQRSPDFRISTHCIVNYVFCSWAETWSSDDYSVKPEQVDENSPLGDKRRMGVHHPKFILLFTNDNKLFVSIGSANFNFGGAVEGSYVCRFDMEQNEIEESGDGIETNFGLIFADFMKMEQLMFKPRGSRDTKQTVTIDTFLEKHVGGAINCLDAFSKNYNFHKAVVSLISTVPGDHAGQISRTSKFIYGSQKIAHTLRQMGARKGWEKRKTDEKDELILQPTSMGVRLDSMFGEFLVRNYLCKDLRKDEQEDGQSGVDMLKRVQMIWPTMDHAIDCTKLGLSFETNIDGLGSSYTCCWDTKTFNESNMDFLAAVLSIYEGSIDINDLYPTTSKEINNIRMMHIKTYARLIKGADVGDYLSFDDFQDNGVFLYQWFMLTSMCMSRAAQGFLEESRDLESDRCAFSNFELGVMFTSDFSSDDKSDHVVYGSGRNFDYYDKKSPSKSKIIRLPVPYSVTPQRYCEPNEIHFDPCPLFHKHGAINKLYCHDVALSACTCEHCQIKKKAKIEADKNRKKSIEDLCKESIVEAEW